MMKIMQQLAKWFKGPTPEEAYAKGRDLARTSMQSAEDKQAVADYLYGMASGGFNVTAAHREFDRGIQDELDAMGFIAPY